MQDHTPQPIKPIPKPKNQKLAQAIIDLSNIYKKTINDLIADSPSTDIIILHFGIGNQTDHTSLTNYIKTHNNPNTEFSLDLYPDFCHGFLKFQSINDAIKLTENLTKSITKRKQAYSADIPYIISGLEQDQAENLETRETFFLYTKLPVNQLCKEITHDTPSGIFVYPDFITKEEEANLLEIIDQHKWNYLSTRKVQHYGYEFIYGANNVNKNNKIGDLPEWCEPSLSKLNDLTRNLNKGKNQDQLTINSYQPGDGIPPHVDAHSPFLDAFASQSLGSSCVMSFKHFNGEVKEVLFPPRSAVILSGEGRYAWKHMIQGRKIDRIDGNVQIRKRRISQTYRAVRTDGVCECQWPERCDSRGYTTMSFKEKNLGADENQIKE